MRMYSPPLTHKPKYVLSKRSTHFSRLHTQFAIKFCTSEVYVLAFVSSCVGFVLEWLALAAQPCLCLVVAMYAPIRRLLKFILSLPRHRHTHTHIVLLFFSPLSC